MTKTWFITGTSRGFGRVWTEAALGRGDRVVATARDASALDDLVAQHGDRVLPLPLDITDRKAVFAAVQRGASHFGDIDVLVHNAGFGSMGTIEEISEAQAREQFDTNVFGALSVLQAIAPIMREQGHGHIVAVSSQLGSCRSRQRLCTRRPSGPWRAWRKGSRARWLPSGSTSRSSSPPATRRASTTPTRSWWRRGCPPTPTSMTAWTS